MEKNLIPFSNIGGKLYSESVYKKLIYTEVETIYRSFFFAERMSSKSGTENSRKFNETPLE